MSKLDLIIKALQVSYAHVPGDIADRHHEALVAARELLDEPANPEPLGKIPTLAEMKKLLNGEPIELAKPEERVCCGDYEKCWKACTPRGRWLAEKELAKPEQEPVRWFQQFGDAPPRTFIEHAVIAGVLFDFMGWLTSRQERLVLSASDEASPAVKVIQEFANMRGLKLEDAQVENWQAILTTPRSAKGSTDSADSFGKRKWVGLTDEEVLDCVHGQFDQRNYWVKIGKAIEAKLKEKNT